MPQVLQRSALELAARAWWGPLRVVRDGDGALRRSLGHDVAQHPLGLVSERLDNLEPPHHEPIRVDVFPLTLIVLKPSHSGAFQFHASKAGWAFSLTP